MARRITTGVVLPRLLLVALCFSLALGCARRETLDLPPAGANQTEMKPLGSIAEASLKGFLGMSAWLELQSGYVAAFARDGVVVSAVSAGYADREAGLPMRIDTRFRLASMTKPVTAVAAMILIQEGRLRLAAPVADFIPEARDLRVATSKNLRPDGTFPTEPLARPLTVRDLLMFQSGIGAKDDDSDLGRIWGSNDIYAGSGSLGDRVARVLSAPLYEQPGQRWRYGWSADVLARVVEVAAGVPFDQFLRERIFLPLGMSDTSFLPPSEQRDRLAAMYTQDADGALELVPLPASDAPFWTPGGSGLVSTAGDYLRFALMLWNRGAYDGVRILSPETVREMTTAHVTEGVLVDEGIEGLGWGYGLAVVVDSDATAMIDEDGDFFWSGYYATTFFVSPKKGLVGVVLAQNQPAENSPIPYPVFLAQSFAYFGS
jgi:CubicO group peptidase (beta-lactamase class C family)